VLSQIYRWVILAVAAVAALTACSGGGSKSNKQSSLDAPFAYDTSKPLQVRTNQTTRERGLEIRDISFKGAAGKTVPAYLVLPLGKGRHPAAIYVHGSGGSRRDLLISAFGLAQRGAVSLALDMNYSAERAPRTPPPQGIQALEAGTNNEIQSVVEVRRAVDLLRSFSYVDGDRIGYVGWSAGARIGAIVAGVDHRIQAFDLLSGGALPVSVYLADQPKDLRPKLEGFLTKTDPLRYAPHAAPSALLFQDGRHDKVVPRKALAGLARAGSRPKEVRWYDSGHVPSEKAWAYSQRWLSKHLDLTRKA
jgi:dienelactone hydrolase